jgi:hypothetical protein
MPVKVVEWTPLAPSANEKHYAGWIDRLAYKMMDDVRLGARTGRAVLRRYF